MFDFYFKCSFSVILRKLSNNLGKTLRRKTVTPNSYVQNPLNFLQAIREQNI